jgi:hypothetical protein
MTVRIETATQIILRTNNKYDGWATGTSWGNMYPGKKKGQRDEERRAAKPRQLKAWQ